MEKREVLVSRISQVFSDIILEIVPFGRSRAVSIWVNLKDIHRVGRFLKEDAECRLDWLENFSVAQSEQDLVVTYFLNSHFHGGGKTSARIIRGSVVLPANGTVVELMSVREIWPMASEYEDEAGELFGIEFISSAGNKVLRRFNRLPDEMSNVFPLRKGSKIPDELHVG